MQEQFNFCAYREQRLLSTASVSVEHFNATLKNTEADNYYNWYAVVQFINNRKRDKKYKTEAQAKSSFFGSMFFQNPIELADRIAYSKELNQFYEVDETDTEAAQLIDFLNLNHEQLMKHRANFVQRKQEQFEESGFQSNEEMLAWFRRHPEDVSFVTALESTLELDLSEFYS